MSPMPVQNRGTVPTGSPTSPPPAAGTVTPPAKPTEAIPPASIPTGRRSVRMSQPQFLEALARFTERVLSGYLSAEHVFPGTDVGAEYESQKIDKKLVPRNAVEIPLRKRTFNGDSPDSDGTFSSVTSLVRGTQTASYAYDAKAKCGYLYLKRDTGGDGFEDYVVRVPVRGFFRNTDFGWPSQPRSFFGWLTGQPSNVFVVDPHPKGKGATVRRALKSEYVRGTGE